MSAIVLGLDWPDGQVARFEGIVGALICLAGVEFHLEFDF